MRPAKRRRHVFLAGAQQRRRTAKTQGAARASLTVVTSPARAERRSGTRAVKATGSCEGSLTTEGIPGCHEPSSFTGWRSRRPRRLSRRSGPREASSSRPARTRARAKAREQRTAEGEATGVSEARSRSAPWEDNAHARERAPPNGAHARHVSIAIRRSGPSDVKRSIPRSSRAEPRLRGASTPRKRRQDPGTREVRVHAFRMGGRSRSDASCVLLTASSQGGVVERGALA